MLPVVIASSVRTGSPVQAFASRAPIATPGHRRAPPSTSAASAIPVGAQIAVTLEFAKASARPAFAVATYTSATSASFAT